MSTKPFEANVRHPVADRQSAPPAKFAGRMPQRDPATPSGDQVAIIDLVGEINALADEALNSAYAQATARNSNTVLLNFSNVDYINSTGIALIVGLLAQARKSGRRVLTCGLSDHYVEIFRITRLADFMTIFPDEASAIQGVKSQA